MTLSALAQGRGVFCHFGVQAFFGLRASATLVFTTFLLP